MNYNTFIFDYLLIDLLTGLGLTIGVLFLVEGIFLFVMMLVLWLTQPPIQ
jgi:hypothetical protein